MDFFDAQDRARGLSRKLVALYVLAVAALVLGVYLVTAFALGVAGVQPGAGGLAVFDPVLFVVVAVGMGVLIGGGTLFRTAQLRKGGAAVAELLGGRRVDPGTADLKERQYLNVVEEVAIASGVPVPEVFVLDREQGINAFAAGHTLNDAAVAMTRGALDAFNRDELQGVVAHEFSHILNGDMRLNIRLMGLLFGILLLTVLGRGIVRGSYFRGGARMGGRRGGGGQIVLVGIALIVLGYLGVLAGRLIQAAVSRQREYLADAAAVQFTRNPAGIAGALKRIGAASHGSRLEDHHAEEASHLFFARGTGRALAGLTATHPPLASRIRRVDPSWDGSFRVSPPTAAAARPEKSPPAPRRPASGTAAGAAGRAVPGQGQEAGVLVLGAVLAGAGSPEAAQVEHARRILGGVPDDARQRLRTPEGALEAALAFVLPPEGSARETAVAEVARRLGDRAARGADALTPVLVGAGPEARLPLLELALPALRTLPRERAAALRDLLGEIIGRRGAASSVTAGTAAAPPGAAAEPRLDPFAIALYHLVRRNLPAGLEPDPAARRGGATPLERLLPEAQMVLSLLAWSGVVGEKDAAEVAGEAKAAFAAGARHLPGGGAELELLPAEALGLGALHRALSRLAVSAPPARRAFLTAAAAVVEADARVELAEAELLRVLAEALEVPLPPLAGIPAAGGAGPVAGHSAGAGGELSDEPVAGPAAPPPSAEASDG